jgi:hypothetical protein
MYCQQEVVISVPHENVANDQLLRGQVPTSREPDEPSPE